MADRPSVVELLLQERRAEPGLDRKLRQLLEERRAELPWLPPDPEAQHPSRLRENLARARYGYLVELTERGRRALKAENDG